MRKADLRALRRCRQSVRDEEQAPVAVGLSRGEDREGISAEVPVVDVVRLLDHERTGGQRARHSSNISLREHDIVFAVYL